MKARRKRIARPKRASSRQRFRIKAPRLPNLEVSKSQQRELAGIGFLLLAGLLVLAVLLQTSGSAMHLLRGGLVGLFGWGVIFVIAAVVAAGAELLAPWIEKMTWGRGLGIALLAISALGLLQLSAGGSGGSVGRVEGEALRNLVGTAGSILILCAVFLGALVLAFDISLRATVEALQEHYLENRPEPGPKPVPKLKKISSEPVHPRNQVARTETDEPVLVPINGVAATPAPEPTLAPELVAALNLGDPVEAATPTLPHKAGARSASMPAEPVLTVVPEEEMAVNEPVAEDEIQRVWVKPDLTLLDTVTVRKERLHDEIKANIKLIETTLASFDVQATVIGVNSGPSVTQYELQPGVGVPVRKITALQNDLALALSAAIRIQAPIPGKPALGIEVPNKATSLVTLREIIQTPTFQNDQTLLSLAIGTDVSGNTVVGDLTRMPHLLIAGATGSGKSVCINALIAGMLFQATPEELKFILIDPKRVEFSLYQDMPHLLVPVVTESDHAVSALRWAVAEMENRYKLFASHTVRNIADFNARAPEMGLDQLPFIVIVIDELADLMMVAAGEIEELICRIAQLARAVGIHLMVATQRPSADIITGLIKANIPSRIAFAVSSSIDSRVILDETGAEKLLGRGDMLYLPVEAGKATRLQGVFVSDREMKAIIDFWKGQGKPQYQEEIFNVEATVSWVKEGMKRDPLFGKGAHVVATEGRASVSLLQRKLNVGYTRAARIIDQLADQRVIGPYEGSKSREVLMNLLEVDELVKDLDDAN
ncbi:MAG TPA: DNA translocase FtsK 4TM domain-containing protein [Candidatus Dormibacteraeota bacterium]|nr:DNA translocase FtsK 4TM domain-containing protein [Candidatus Dormibacteraeota bacterium]